MSAPRVIAGAVARLAVVVCLVVGLLGAVPHPVSSTTTAAAPAGVADARTKSAAPRRATATGATAAPAGSVASEAAQRGSFATAAAADPVGCGYGEGGQYDDTICWLDMAGYDDTQARTAAGQDMTVTLPGGYTLRYNIKTAVVPGRADRAVTAVTTPIERQANGDSRFAFGSEAYRNIPGRPSLYSANGANTGLDVTLSSIRLEDSVGNPVSSFSFVATDTEDNVNGESLRWTSDKPLNLLETLYPHGTKGCKPAGITGLGTTEVNCTGTGGPSALNSKSTSILVSADAPNTFALRWLTGARSGIAFGINTASVQVTKVVQGRAASTDSFDVSVMSPEGSTLATASTGTAANATTGRVVVIPPINGGSFTLTDAVTPGSGTDMDDYTRSWSCIRNGQPDPSLPSGGAATVQVSPGANESIACTVTNTVILDFGDAPDSYGTTSGSDGARHGRGGPRLGATSDLEADGQPSPTADGDGSDEDGVHFNTDVTAPGRLETVFVDASANGFLNAWIDYNRDGDFDGSEQIFSDRAVTSGTNALTYDVPSDFVPGESYARFRITGSAGQATSPTGAAPGGEVEDYARTLFDAEQTALEECPSGSTPFPLSFIQNPSFEERTNTFTNGRDNTIKFAQHWYDSHPTGGQYHVFEPPGGFNSGPGEGPNGMPFRAGADGYGFLGGHSVFREIGEGATNTLTTPLVGGVTYVGFFSIGAGGYGRSGSGFMRFFGVDDPDIGSINDPAVELPTATNSEFLTDTITVSPAPTGQRPQWKIATFALTPTKAWEYLRVEARNASINADRNAQTQVWMSFDDFYLYSCQSTSDFGDAPSTYGTSIGSSPAFHVVSGYDGTDQSAPLMLGSSVDLDADGAPGPAADGDDTAGTDDEDGAAAGITTRAGADTTVSVSATNDTATTATLAGWIDADRNGTFEASERQTVTVPASSGRADYTLTFPEPSAAGNTYARFRLLPGTVLDPQPTGTAIGGEVEDYSVTSEFVSDFGDAPATYGTTLADGGPRHTIAGYDAQDRTARLTLGATIDDEADALATTTANGDDGTTVDDEDGVSDAIAATIGQPSTVTVSVKNTRNQPATVAGWLDLDRDGTFEAGERVTDSVPANAGSVTRQLTFPAATVEGVTYARFRVFPGDVTDPTPTGAATAGEVEDHPATISQTGPVVTCDTDPAIFNTAYDGNGGTLPAGSRDTRWEAGLGNATGPDSVPSWIRAWVVPPVPRAWAPSTFGNADWISYYSDSVHSGEVNVYFRYRFRIAPEVSLGAFALPMSFYADNSVPEVWVNGVAQSPFADSIPQSSNVYYHGGFTENARAETVISNGFQHGPNTIIVRVGSGAPNMGFMAQIGPSPVCADAGDAPASYGTTKPDNGAAHGLAGYDDDAHTADLMLGDSVDADVDGVPSAGADSDDTSRTDDEDALSTVSLAAGATSVSLDVPVTNDSGGSATLHGWVDANGNGTFQPGEHASVAVPDGASSATLAWTGLTALTDGSQPYLRLRLTSDTLTDAPGTATLDERAIGAASDGEVEDHRAVVGSAFPTGCTSPFVEDFGTGPNYSGPLPAGQTTYTHRTSGAVQDGSYTLASDIDPATMGAWWHRGEDHTVGDDAGLMMLINAAFASGEFFRRTFSGLVPGATYDFSAWATNALNRTSGILPNITFRVVNPRTGAVIASVNSGDIPLSSGGLVWRRYGLQFEAPGQTVRLELVNNADGGSGNDLAIDDISFNLACDWGDAPAGYGTLAGDDGPVHATTGPMLGTGRDGEADGLPTQGADGDDTAGTDDEDGAPSAISLTVGQQADVAVTVTNDESQPATLAGWVDLDADGSFEPSELVTAEVPAGAGTVQRTLTFPGAASTADTYARFRVFPGTPSTVSPTGPAPGGEVEDHPVSIGSPTVTCATDPAVFNTAYNGAGGKLATGSTDRVWKVGLGDPTGPASVGSYIPAYVVPPLFNWTPSPFGNADWISYWPHRNQGSSNVDLYFRYRFRIGDDVPADHLAMSMDFYADNSVPDVWVNGVSQDPLQASLPQAPGNPYGHVGFGSGSQASTVLTGFRTGVNDIVVRVASGPGYAGFMAQMRATLCSDWGDAPNSYGTASPGGASHGVPDFDPADAGAEMTLGSSVDVESTGTPGAGADDDDTTDADDEDGVAGDIEMTVGEPTTVEVSATADDTATLAGWLDADGDGTFEAGERVVVPVAAGTDTYDLTFPAGTPTGGVTYARFRLFPGDVAGPAPTGPAPRGEVEDYRVTVLRPGLDIEKTSDATADTRPGDVVNYTVTLTNTGDGAFTAANPARMVDDLAGVLDDATYNGDAVASVDGTTVTAPTYAAPRIRWEGPLAAGKSVVVEYSVTVKGGGDGTGRNVAWVPGGPTPGPTPDCTSGPVAPPPLPLGTELLSNGSFTTGGPNGQAVAPPWAFQGSGAVQWSSPFRQPNGVVGPTISFHPGDAGTAGGSIRQVVDDLQVGGTFRLRGRVGLIASANNGAGSSQQMTAQVLDASGAVIATQVVTLPFATGTTWPDPGGVVDLSFVAPTDEVTVRFTDTSSGPSFSLNVDMLFDDASLVQTAEAPGSSTAPCATETFLLPKLTVAKSASRNNLPEIGEEVTYTVTVRNDGPGTWTADEPGLVDDLSDVEDDAAMVGQPTASSGAATYDPDVAELTWSGDLDPDESATITYTFEYEGTGNHSLVNTACVPVEHALDQQDSCRDTVTPGSGLDQGKTSTPASGTAVDPGDEITYTLRFSNTGQAEAIVDTSDDLSMVLDDATLTTGPTADAGLTATLVGDTLEIDGRVPVGETLLVTYTVTVKPWADQGDHSLRNKLACQSPDPVACEPDEVEHPVRRLEVEKSITQAPADPRPGDQVTYTVTATNPGPGAYTDDEPAVVLDDLSDVLDDATLDDGATATIDGNPVAAPTTVGQLLSWSGALPAGETVTITYTVTLVGGGDGTVRNTAFVPDCDPGASDCDPTPPDCVRGTDPATGLSCDSEELLLPKLRIDKEATPAQAAAVGDEITYTVTITNDGPGDYTAAEPATFTDDLSDVLEDATFVADSETAPAGTTVTYAAPNLTWSGPLPSGQSAEITYKVSYTGADDQTLVNSACFPAAEAARGSEECASVTVRGAALEQAKTSDPVDGTDVRVGQRITYTLTFTNDGEVPARVDTADDLSDVLDDADLVGTPTAEAPLQATRSGNSLEVTGEVPAGATRTVTYTVVVTSAGDGVLRNSLACPPGAPAACEPDTTEHEVQSLEITKSSDADADTRLGDTVTYTVTVHNPGAPYTAAEPAVVVDDLSGVLDDGDLVGNPSAEVGGTAVAAPTLADQRLRWEGPLAADATLVITYQVKLTAGGDGVVRNVAWVPQGPPGPTPDCDDPALDLPCADEEFTLPRLSVAKTADRDDLPARGERVTYSVVVRNEGPGNYTADEPASFVDDLSDVLDDATLVAGSITATTGDATFTSPNLSWTGALAAGQIATITYTVEYHGDGDRVLVNSACVPESQALDPAADCDTVMVPGSGLTQTKTSDPDDGSAVRAGQEITYTLSFTNHGQAAARVDATDDLSAVLDDADLTAGPTAQAGLNAVVEGERIRVTGSVPAGETLTVTYTVTVSPYGEQGDHVLRNALACPPGSPATCQPDTTVHPVRHLKVSKSSDATAGVDTGSVVEYTVTVHNDGATAYTADDPATVVDDLSDVLDDATWNDDAEASSGELDFSTPTLTWTGPLDVGQTVTITYSVTVTNQGDHDLRNTVDVPGCDDGCEPPPVVTPLPHVVPSKTVDPPSGTSVAAGDVVTYTLSWTNDGQAAGAVDATDDLSDILDDAELTAGPTSSDPDVVVTREGDTLRIEGPIEPGQTVTVTYEVTVLPDGERGDNQLANTLDPDVPQVVCDEDGDCDPVDPPVTENPVGELDDWKTVDPASGEVTAGDVVTYTLHFTNRGEGPVEVDREDDLSGVLDDAELVSGPTSSDPALEVSEVEDGRFSVTGTLEPGQTVTVTYEVRVKPDGQRGDGDLQNFLVDPGEEPPPACDPQVDDDCTENPVTDVDVTKSVDPASGTDVTAGDRLTYTLTFTNNGNGAGDVRFVDHLGDVLDDAELVEGPTSSDPAVDATINGDRLTIDGTLQPGQAVTVTYVVEVLPYDEQGDHQVVNYVLPPGQDLPDKCVGSSDDCTWNDIDPEDDGNPPDGDPDGDDGSDPDGDGLLPDTGNPVGLGLLLLALGLVLGGGVLMVASRRRSEVGPRR